MNFILSHKTIFYERAQRVSKILFLPQENKIHIFKLPCKCNLRDKLDINEIIDKLTCEIMENKPLGSRM